MPEIYEVDRDGFRRMSGEDQELFREPRAYDVSLQWLLAAGRRASLFGVRFICVPRRGDVCESSVGKIRREKMTRFDHINGCYIHRRSGCGDASLG